MSFYAARKMKKIIGAQDFRTQMAKIGDEMESFKKATRKKQCTLYPKILKKLNTIKKLWLA